MEMPPKRLIPLEKLARWLCEWLKAAAPCLVAKAIWEKKQRCNKLIGNEFWKWVYHYCTLRAVTVLSC
jgi:hypothetical protein